MKMGNHKADVYIILYLRILRKLPCVVKNVIVKIERNASKNKTPINTVFNNTL